MFRYAFQNSRSEKRDIDIKRRFQAKELLQDKLGSGAKHGFAIDYACVQKNTRQSVRVKSSQCKDVIHSDS